MLSEIENTRRSNHSIFFPQSFGSPFNDAVEHISGLGLGRLDYERCAIAGEVIYTVEGDSTPVSQQDEEARIATLAHALKSLGNREDAAEFMRCLNAMCVNADALYRQSLAKHYYREIDTRDTNEVLKEMALLAMQLPVLNSIEDEDAEVIETDGVDTSVEATWMQGSYDENIFPMEEHFCPIFQLELREKKRLLKNRKSATFARDQWIARWKDLEESGAQDMEEIDNACRQVEALEQYDEGGVIVVMSAHERTIACGRLDPEFTAEDLPAKARHLAGQLRCAYTDGVEINEIWEKINAQLETIFPMFGGTAEGGWFFSHANAEWQRFTREALESLLEEYCLDCHLTAMHHSQAYRRFYQQIREADDTKIIGQAMKDAYAAKESGELSLKHFTLLKTASTLQRERLMNAQLSPVACKLIREVETASPAKLRHLSWAFYGNNQPGHPVHQLSSQERSRVWDALKARKHFFAERGVAIFMAPFLSEHGALSAETRALFLAEEGVLSAEARTLFEVLRMALSYYRVSRLPKRPAFHRERDRQVNVTVRRVHREDRLHHRA